MVNQYLELLAKTLNLTKLEPEPYILTQEEEEKVIAYAIESEKKQMTWKMSDLGYFEEQVKMTLSKINWDEKIDRKEILDRANSNKHREIWHQEQRDREKAEKKEAQEKLQAYWTAKNMYQLMAHTSVHRFKRKLDIDEYSRPIIEILCRFLSNDPEFENLTDAEGEKYSLNCGLLLRGVSGLGKTFLVECLQNNGLNPVCIVNTHEIEQGVKESGSFKIEMGQATVLCLDDVGAEEPEVNHYGTKINWVRQFIEGYYLRRPDAFNKLILSTNDSFSDLERKYGFRVRSRMKAMFNVVNVMGEDRRKRN